MLFNSFQFLLFFVVVWLLFMVTRGTARKIILLIASYYFYMCWSTRYIFVIWAITLIDYVAGLQIEKAQQPSRRRLYLGVSLFCNLGLLFAFKYLNFFTGSIRTASHLFGLQYDPALLAILLPVGLSFHTFQAMSYTIEVYRRRVPAEKNLLEYALYVAFFPQMVAGPIERPYELLPQFHREPRVTLDGVRAGMVQALWGLFKKMVIADNVADFVRLIYDTPRHYNGAALVLATLLFSIQIYCDFSGYTDIALGLARMMGYELRINFMQPYFSRSVGEFWRRWHISLSTWFRLRLYSAGRQPREAVPALFEFDDHLCDQRALARRQLDLCRLGLSARTLSDRGPGHVALRYAMCRGAGSPSCAPVDGLMQNSSDLRSGDLCLDIFSS
jgi:D-alanyl-lipoteichoic acid acyltransferase DltB (MBOAT superfamily)